MTQTRKYPYWDGRMLIFACCVSTIGKPCAHRVALKRRGF